MTTYYRRINSFIENIKLLSPLVGGVLPALTYIVTSRGNPDAKKVAAYKDFEFMFRRRDLSALKEFFLNGEYTFLEDTLKNIEAPRVYDIGGHIGLFSILVLSINPHSVIDTIEASPDTYNILSYNVQKAKEKGFQWNCRNNAAWKNSENIRFSDNVESSMSHKVNAQGTISVPGITLETLLNEANDVSKIDLMKIDIEGAEEAFLCPNDKKADISTINSIVIELHPELCDTDKVLDTLKDNFTSIKECHDEELSKPLLYCNK